VQFPAGLVTVEIIRFLPVGFVLQKSGGAVVFLLFSSIGRIELADGQSPQCDRTLLVHIERREPGNSSERHGRTCARGRRRREDSGRCPNWLIVLGLNTLPRAVSRQFVENRGGRRVMFPGPRERRASLPGAPRPLAHASRRALKNARKPGQGPNRLHSRSRHRYYEPISIQSAGPCMPSGR
jgi:hypothetical protein